MKKQPRSILLFIAVTFIILIGCSKGDSQFPPAVNNSSDLTTTSSVSTPTSVITKAGDNIAQRTASTPTPITITAPFTDIGTYPIFPGTFTISGAFETSGEATMDAGFNDNFIRAHCILTLIDKYGTIIIHEECQFGSIPHKGRWEIVSGTGAYANLRGNGSNTMSGPGELEEDLVGFIY